MPGILLAALLDDSLCILKIGEMIIVFIKSDSTSENGLPDISFQVTRFWETVYLSRSLWCPNCTLIYNGLKELIQLSNFPNSLRSNLLMRELGNGDIYTSVWNSFRTFPDCCSLMKTWEESLSQGLLFFLCRWGNRDIKKQYVRAKPVRCISLVRIACLPCPESQLVLLSAAQPLARLSQWQKLVMPLEAVAPPLYLPHCARKGWEAKHTKSFFYL